MERSRRVPGVGASMDSVLGRLQRGYGDPTLQRAGGGWWRAVTTPEGTALMRLVRDGDDAVVHAVGDGADWAIAQAHRLLSADDRPDDFHPTGPARAAARRGMPRIGATDLVADAVAPCIIEQKVTGAEAFTGIRRLVRRFGTPPPGRDHLGAGAEQHVTSRMACPPDAQDWARIPTWDFLQVGVEERRAVVVHRVMLRMPSIERRVSSAPGDPTARGEVLEQALRTIPGIGPWTSARVRQQALGDPDAWSVDDYHVPGLVLHHLGGEDASAVLEEFRPHRYRMELLLMRLGMPERHGPRRSLPTHLPVRGGWRG